MVGGEGVGCVCCGWGRGLGAQRSACTGRIRRAAATTDGGSHRCGTNCRAARCSTHPRPLSQRLGSSTTEACEGVAPWGGMPWRLQASTPQGCCPQGPLSLGVPNFQRLLGSEALHGARLRLAARLRRRQRRQQALDLHQPLQRLSNLQGKGVEGSTVDERFGSTGEAGRAASFFGNC